MELKQLGAIEIRQVGIDETRIIPLSEEAKNRVYFVAERFGIKAEMYEKEPDLLVCPQVNAEKPGTGKFDVFLKSLKRAVAFRGKRLVFACVTNKGIYKYLQANNIPVLIDDILYEVDFMTEEERIQFEKDQKALEEKMRELEELGSQR